MTVLAGLAMLGFTLLVGSDLHTGRLISPYLPQGLHSEVYPVIPALPLVGLLGIIFSNLFTPYEV